MIVRRNEPDLDLLTKAYDHIQTSCSLVKEGNYRDFCSRFYYAYITLLRGLYDCRGDYERYGEHSWMDREEELREFLCTDFLTIIDAIVYEVKSLRDHDKIAYLIIKKIREISRWLKLLRLTLER